jgi:BirA family biotin operon repressor/biotin-[acetyl-CoA-carboxylase] ligase
MRHCQLGDGVRHPATSLLEEGGSEVNRLRFTRTLLAELDDLYHSFLAEGEGGIRAEWLERSALSGQLVRVECGDRSFTGVVQGVDAFGALLVLLACGTLETVLSGDVTLICS